MAVCLFQGGEGPPLVLFLETAEVGFLQQLPIPVFQGPALHAEASSVAEVFQRWARAQMARA